jgi:hypothetical protein
MMPILVEYLLVQQVRLYRTSRNVVDGTASRKMTTLQMNRCIYRAFPARYMSKGGVSAYDQSYDIKPEKKCGTKDNFPSTGNVYTDGYRPVLT